MEHHRKATRCTFCEFQAKTSGHEKAKMAVCFAASAEKNRCIVV